MYEDTFLKSQLFQRELCDWDHEHRALRVMKRVFQGHNWDIEKEEHLEVQ